MRGSIEEHIGAPTLERYSCQKLGLEAQGVVEDHLLVCAVCRDWLTGIEPFNMIHHTEDGPFYSRVTLLQGGSVWAHHWGCQIDGGGRYRDSAAASKYLLDSFEQMFPEHECGEACVDTKPIPNQAHTLPRVVRYPSPACWFGAIVRMDGSKTMWYLPETLREIEECDDSIVLELIASFQKDTAGRLARLHDAISQLDAATVKAEAHSMRGSARQMGAEALADPCQAVESGAPQRNWPELEYQVNQAEARFAETCSAMSEYVKANRHTG